MLRAFGDNICSHFPKGRNDTIHGSPRKRSIANQTAFKCLTREQAGQEPHGCSGVSTINFTRRGGKHSPFSMNDELVRFRLLYLNSESAQSVHGMHAIFARQETVQGTNAIGQSRDDGDSMGDALVSRNRDLGINSRCSLYPQFHRSTNKFRRFAVATAMRCARRSASNIRYGCPALLHRGGSNMRVTPHGQGGLNYGTRKIFL